MTCTDINTLTRQKELLLQKLSTFEETNRTLRDLLKDQHSKEVSSRPQPQPGAPGSDLSLQHPVPILSEPQSHRL